MNIGLRRAALSSVFASQKGSIGTDNAALRSAGLRLAAVTVGSLCIMLLLLGSIIFLLTAQTLHGALEETLRERAQHPPRFLIALLRANAAALPNGPASAGAPAGPGDGYYTIVDRSAVVLGGTGPNGHIIVSRSGADAAAQAGTSCCAEVRYDGNSYLIYSQAYATPDGQVVGIIQASVSEHQYAAALSALLRGLFVVSIIGVFASATLSAFLVRRSLHPIALSMRRQRDFVADAAHELRTPLTIQRTALELGLSTISGVEGQETIEQSLSQNVHLTRLVENLSLLARADSGVLGLDRRMLDLAALVRETAGAIELLAEERTILFTVEGPETIPMQGDIGRLRQLLLILFDNALKWTPDGGAIRATLESHPSRARLQVQDNGPGIEPDDLPYIFDRFYRADRSRSGEGMGLGLPIGRWIVEAHNGSIAAGNSPDGGAIFTITFPLGSSSSA